MERGLRFTRTPTPKQALNADILVEVGPVDPFAPPDQPPVASLSGRPVHEPRVPRKRHGQGPTIHQIDDQCILGDTDVLSQGGTQINW